MEHVFWNLELEIKSGRYDDLVALMSEMSTKTLEHEPDTLNYEWFISDDKQTCHIYERYINSEAVLTHLGNFQTHFAERFFDILDAERFMVYGKVSDTVRGALASIGAQFMDRLGGFTR